MLFFTKFAVKRFKKDSLSLFYLFDTKKMLIYNVLINTFSAFVGVLGAVVRPRHPRKFFRFVAGRRNIIRHIRNNYSRRADTRPTVWVHSASFGEYSVARPIIQEFRRQGMCVVATFFSPSGYEAVKGKREVDFVYYLPVDTVNNARDFLDIIKPDKAVFTVSEYWYNFLDQLKKRDIDTYLVSAKINADSVFFKWYGTVHRKCLDAYKHIFVIDQASKERVQSLGHSNVSINGNPLFDNAIQKASTSWHNDIIEHFCQGQRVFVVGSLHDDNDLCMVSELANRHPETKFLIVPHEISEKSSTSIIRAIKADTAVYSQCSAQTDFSHTQALIIDFMGSLAYIYRYGTWAYIGGGFTKYLHSLVEATVYGLPVCFGPETRRKITPLQMIDLGIGTVVHDSDQLDRWYTDLAADPQRMAEISQKAKAYVNANAGATREIVNKILQ